jgi:proteic killer suppression protein
LAIVIRGFACKDTERLYHGERVRRWSDEVSRMARRKLAQIAVSLRLSDLAVPPGNHLEALKGARKGQQSIRVNDQWRLCFVWRGDAADDVELIDYH